MGNTVFAGAGLGAARVLGEPVLVVEAFARGNLVEGACELVPCVRPKQAIGVPELAGNLVQRGLEQSVVAQEGGDRGVAVEKGVLAAVGGGLCPHPRDPFRVGELIIGQAGAGIGGDPQLGYMLRNKLFWKDSMDLRHGEHSHSLQWLAIAQGWVSIPVARYRTFR